jgi:hypothetical protein
VGVRFVEANREEVTVQFAGYQTAPAALGLIVLTSVLLGMLIAGVLCSIELMILVMQNRRLRRRSGEATSLPSAGPAAGGTPLGSSGPLATPFPPEQDRDANAEFNDPRTTNRFTPL